VTITFADMSEMPEQDGLPPLDRLYGHPATPAQRQWRYDGVVVLRDFFDAPLVDAYSAVRGQVPEPHFEKGWPCSTAYEHIPEMRALCLHNNLMPYLQHLIGEPMLLHLVLPDWTSTERNWHQDDYLNPPAVNSWYAAVWIALDDIDADAGLFEYIPGSHRWPLMRREKVLAHLTPEEHQAVNPHSGAKMWPKMSERFVVPAIEAEIAARGVAPVRFHARKGDVLIWHGRLMHRGSAPARPGVLRKSLIAHYSGVNHRPDMPHRRREHGGEYAVFNAPLWGRR